MRTINYFSIKFEDDKFIFLDQTKLPHQEVYVATEDYERIAVAIEKLEVRGAPLIGVSAAYGLALSLKNIKSQNVEEVFYKAYNRLSSTRPTAVNLFMALDHLKTIFETRENDDDMYQLLLSEAKNLHSADKEKCRLIGLNALPLFTKKANVLTHCNTGLLATAGDGTAFNVIKTASEHGLINMVFVDETRPLFQGSRLTAFELEKHNIPFNIQTDSCAAVLMQQGKIDLVVTGADRIALNGDTANKIGTYALAVLCNFHNIPFYIAAPTTTIDRKTISGADIKIEFRNKLELLSINGNRITSENYEAFTPAFDVTPSHLIRGIITDEQVYFFPYNFLR